MSADQRFSNAHRNAPHRTSPDERQETRHIGTYALVAFETQIAGY